MSSQKGRASVDVQESTFHYQIICLYSVIIKLLYKLDS